MSAMVTTRIPGLPGEAYDQIASQLDGALRNAPGFIAHAATVDPDGITVTELWEAEANWQQFFDTYVKPNLPAGVPTPSVTNLRNTIVR